MSILALLPCSAWKCEATNTKAEPTKISTGKRRFTGRALHVNLSRPIANLPAKDCSMPEEDAVERAREDEREGKSPSTQAGEFVREEMEHIRAGEHGARSPEQAIAIGLSKARRAGVELPPPKRGSRKTKRQARRDLAKGRRGRETTVAHPITGNQTCIATGRPFRCIATKFIETSSQNGATPRSSCSFPSGQKAARTLEAKAVIFRSFPRKSLQSVFEFASLVANRGNMRVSRRLLALSICALLTVGSFSQIHAVPITGSASFFGSAAASGPSGGGSTSITFASGWTFEHGIGIFAGIPSEHRLCSITSVLQGTESACP